MSEMDFETQIPDKFFCEDGCHSRGELDEALTYFRSTAPQRHVANVAARSKHCRTIC